MRFQVGDPVWICGWLQYSVVSAVDEIARSYTLSMSEFSQGWKEAELQSCAMSVAGPVRNKKWRRNGHGGR